MLPDSLQVPAGDGRDRLGCAADIQRGPDGWHNRFSIRLHVAAGIGIITVLVQFGQNDRSFGLDPVLLQIRVENGVQINLQGLGKMMDRRKIIQVWLCVV